MAKWIKKTNPKKMSKTLQELIKCAAIILHLRKDSKQISHKEADMMEVELFGTADEFEAFCTEYLEAIKVIEKEENKL